MIAASTCFWFDGRGLEAARFYVSLVPGSELLHSTDAPDPSLAPTEGPMLVRFRLAGQEFAILNGGPHYTLSPAASIVLTCETQDEIDRLWTALTADGGEESRCGWCVDRFGVSWQIIPAAFDRWFSSGDMPGLERMTAAMMQMGKLDLPALERAFAGEA